MTRRLRWAELGWQDFAARDMAATIAVLPIAAIEQHGPHLPVGVDSMIGEGHLGDVMAALPEDVPALFLPLQSIGKSNEHLHFPGTLTLTAEAALAAWLDIGASVARAGCRKLVVVNSHGGNVSLMDILTRELRVRHGMLAVQCSWHGLGEPEGLFSERERLFGIHGGDYETSLMLSFRPDLVDMAKAADFRSSAEALAAEAAVLRLTRPVGYGWMAQDANPVGVVGEAHLATAAKGEAVRRHVAERFIAVLRDVQRFPLAALKPGPLQEA
jgi:creatinine amidohydrolase